MSEPESTIDPIDPIDPELTAPLAREPEALLQPPTLATFDPATPIPPTEYAIRSGQATIAGPTPALGEMLAHFGEAGQEVYAVRPNGSDSPLYRWDGRWRAVTE